ncbi:hypothetical protein AB0I50_45410, partial [Streptomyces prunicolor]
MPEAVIVSAVRTAIGTAYKGSLSETSAEDLARHVVAEAVERSGLAPESFDDVVLAESMYGGGDLARHAAVSLGMTEVAGQAVNRHCAGSLTAVGIAAGSVRAGMDQAVIAGGAQSSSLAPKTVWRVPGTVDRFEERMAPTFPYTADATDDVTLSTGWNVALEAGLTREQLDAWAYRSHARAVAAIDADVFVDEIASIKVPSSPRCRTVVGVLLLWRPVAEEVEVEAVGTAPARPARRPTPGHLVERRARP